MLEFIRLNSRWLAALWFIIMSVLFFLPGSALPKENYWMTLVHFDKWIHFGLFAVLLFLLKSFNLNKAGSNTILLILAFIYGLSVEFIQKEWIPNRSFDLFDVLADMIGGSAGVFICVWVYKKNKPL